MQENVVKKYTRNTRINATILCKKMYGVKVYTKNTHDYEKYTRNTRINATIFMQEKVCKKIHTKYTH